MNLNAKTVLASLLLDFTKAEFDEDEVRSLGTYTDLLHLDLKSNCCKVFMCLPTNVNRAEEATSAALEAKATQAPVRVLVKHKPMNTKMRPHVPSLLPFIRQSVLQLAKVIDFPKQMQAHYLGLFVVVDVTNTHVVLRKHLELRDSAAKSC